MAQEAEAGCAAELAIDDAGFLGIPKPSSKIVDLFGGSQRASFDKALGQILGMIANDFEVYPGFAFFDDRDQGMARAWRAVRIPNTRDGTVIFGLNLLEQLLSLEHGDIAVAAVCAHEFGHIYQYKTDMDKTLRHNMPNFCFELHADYLAGWFLAKLKYRRPGLRISQAGAVIEGNGTSDFSATDFHGTPKQRKNAIERGYFDSRADINQQISAAADAGYVYLLNKYT